MARRWAAMGWVCRPRAAALAAVLGLSHCVSSDPNNVHVYPGLAAEIAAAAGDAQANAGPDAAASDDGELDAAQAPDLAPATDSGLETVAAADTAPTADAAVLVPDAAVKDTGVDSAVVDTAAADTKLPPKLLPSSKQFFDLQNAAFPAKPGQPSVLVYVPANFDPTPPVAVAVYLHGWYNCIANCAGDVDTACTPGGPPRKASKIISQFEGSKRNALLVLPEAKFDQPSGDPGNLEKPNGFKTLLGEVLQKMAPVLGPLTTADIGHLVVAGHSGAYLATAAIASGGGLPVHEVWLLDSLYGSEPAFLAWIKQNIAAFGSDNPARRFFDVYTDNGGTMDNSQAFVPQVAALLPKGSPALLHDPTTATWPQASYHHGVLFKHSALSHDGVTQYYFGQLVQSAQQMAQRP